MSGGGPLYDDGSVQIACKVEIRGSQGRLTLFLRNQGPGDATSFVVTVQDPAGLLRHQLSPLSTSSLAPRSQTEQQMLMECMKPAFPSPQLCISYTNSVTGVHRDNSFDLPIHIATFNEPLPLTSEDFLARWQLLSGAGQQVQEVFTLSRPIVPEQVHDALYKVRF